MSSIYLHCLIGLFVRLLLVGYGEVHDKLFMVQYTDVDYHVFTDAAHHIVSGRSPYIRHTYRYTPLIALLLVPNVLLHSAFGKILFSLIDVSVGYIIHKLLLVKGCKESTANNCSMLWLYNPLSIVISTRGNADALSAALVLASLLSVQTGYVTVTGVIHAIATHVRLYPLIFTLPLYLAAKGEQLSYVEVGKASSKKVFLMLLPNRNQFNFAAAYVGVLSLTTVFCWWLYGYQFLYESFLYHISRRDTRHNFSVHFYMLYLTYGEALSLWHKISISLPQAVLLILLSFTYGSAKDLEFCFLTQTIVMVTFNTVVTSQYFIWFLSILPVCMPFIAISNIRAAALFAFWICEQVLWLVAAYLLEFQGFDTFVYIWLHGIAFFSINIAILVTLIQTYTANFTDKVKNI